MRAGSGIPPARAPGQLTKGEGYGSNRSREGPHPSSSGRWQAERGRRGAGAARLARSKGPPAPRDDDGRGQIANFARPRSRPHGLISAEPRAIDRGIPLWTVTEPTRGKAGTCAGEGPLPKENPADGGAQVLGRTNSEGRRARSANSNAQPRVGFLPSIKNFRRPRCRSPPPGPRRRSPDPRFRSSPRKRGPSGCGFPFSREGVEFALRVGPSYLKVRHFLGYLGRSSSCAVLLFRGMAAS
jgi:hypothetical protein